MNKEVIKAMKKKKNLKIIQWYREHYEIIWRTILFPFYFLELAINKYNDYKDSKTKWSEERAKEILNYYIPRRADWVEKDKTFYVFDNGYGWSSAKKYLKRKDRRFWNLYACWTGSKIRNYLIDEFELDGFEKVIMDCSGGWTELTFEMIENK